MQSHPDSLDVPLFRDAQVLAGDPAAHGELASETPARQRAQRGQSLVVAGFVVTVTGIVGYCAACFTDGVGRDFDEIVSGNAVPFAGLSLAVVGLGTVLWLVGSLLHLSGLMDLDPCESERDAPTPPHP